MQIRSIAFYINKICITCIESDVVGVVFLVFMLKSKVPIDRDEQGIFVPSKISAELIQNKKQ